MTTHAAWELPEPVSTLDVPIDAGTVTTVRRHGNPSGPRIVLTHGAGLAADLYYPFWSLLTDDFDLAVYDLRDHGWNSVGAQQDHNIPTLIRDHHLVLESVDRVYGSKPTVGISHSVTAVVTLLSFNKLYSARVLFDPPLAKSGANQIELHDAAEHMAERIRRRENWFKKREDFVTLLKILPMFRRTVPGVPELMAQTTLRESENGEGYELRCPREYEAQLMNYARSYFALLDLELVACPTKIIGADPTLPHAYLPNLDMRLASAMDYDFIPETTHLLQLEKPEECVAATRAFLQRLGIA